MLALLMTRPVLAFVELAVGGGDTSQAGTVGDYTNGLVGRIPIALEGPRTKQTLTNIAAEIVTLLREQAAFDETAPEFHRSTLACPSGKKSDVGDSDVGTTSAQEITQDS